MSAERPVRRGRNIWGAVGVAVLVVAVAGYFVYRALNRTQQTATYVTSTAQTGTLTVAVAANGSAQTARSASVDPVVSGTVNGLQVKIGSHVKQGDLLFTLDNPDLDGSVAQALASYRQSKSSVVKACQQVEQADSDLDKLESQEASRPGSVTDDQFEIARIGIKAAKSGLSAATASKDSSYMSYQQALKTADQRQVKAPTDGYVTTLNVQNGDSLGGGGTSSRTSGTSGGTASTTSGSSSTPMVISDLSSIQAQVQVAETDRPKIKLGQKATMTFDALPDLTITGKVTSIDAVGTTSQNVVTFNVVTSFDVQDKRVSPGMTVAANIITEVKQGVLMVPNSAVKTATDGTQYVQVLAANSTTPEQRTVTVGSASDTDTEISSGLKAGEKVVTQTVQPNSTSATTGGGLGILGGGGGRPPGAGGAGR